MRARFVTERGSYDTVYAPNRDWEVLDLSRTASRRVIARASHADALLIAAALNDAVASGALTELSECSTSK